MVYRRFLWYGTLGTVLEQKIKNRKSTMQNPVAGYDFTLSVEKFPDKTPIIEFLRGYAKKWAFQKEEGEPKEDGGEGYVHWQGRCSLMSKRRLNKLISITKEIMPTIHWSPTCSKVHNGSVSISILL